MQNNKMAQNRQKWEIWKNIKRSQKKGQKIYYRHKGEELCSGATTGWCYHTTSQGNGIPSKKGLQNLCCGCRMKSVFLVGQKVR